MIYQPAIIRQGISRCTSMELSNLTIQCSHQMVALVHAQSICTRLPDQIEVWPGNKGNEMFFVTLVLVCLALSLVCGCCIPIMLHP